MKKTAAIAPALLVTAALTLSGCSAQLSQADTCKQLKSIMDISKSAGSSSSTDSQKLDAAKAMVGQIKDLSGKASDDLKGDLGLFSDFAGKALQAMENKDAAAAKDLTNAVSRDQYKSATDHISSVCKVTT